MASLCSITPSLSEILPTQRDQPFLSHDWCVCVWGGMRELAAWLCLAGWLQIVGHE